MKYYRGQAKKCPTLVSWLRVREKASQACWHLARSQSIDSFFRQTEMKRYQAERALAQKPEVVKGTESDVQWADQAGTSREYTRSRSGSQRYKGGGYRLSKFCTSNSEFICLTLGQKMKFFQAGTSCDQICFKVMILSVVCGPLGLPKEACKVKMFFHNHIDIICLFHWFAICTDV